MFKNFVSILTIIIISYSNLFSHQQPIHQYITREAFKLLKKSFPTQLAEMEAYIGDSEIWSGLSADGSFGALKVVSGAWLEDEYDVVYGYGLTKQPNYNQSIPINTILSIYGGLREAHTTVSHFWDADNGENAPTSLSDYFEGDVYWSFTVPVNAMTKIRKYENGLYDFIWAYNNNRMSWTWCGLDQIQLMTKFNISSLNDLYNSVGSLDAFSFYAENGRWYGTDCPSWDESFVAFNKAHAYEIFGRMCHLLGDMSVPAHVHNDAHAGKRGMYYDVYEKNTHNYHMWTADEIYSAGKRFINPYNEWNDPLYYLMYFMNQVTDHYASGRTNGDNLYDSNCPDLSSVITTLGSPTLKETVK